MEFFIFYSPAYIKMILSRPTYNIYHLHTATLHNTYEEFDKVQTINCRFNLMAIKRFSAEMAVIMHWLKNGSLQPFLQAYR